MPDGPNDDPYRPRSPNYRTVAVCSQEAFIANTQGMETKSYVGDLNKAPDSKAPRDVAAYDERQQYDRNASFSATSTDSDHTVKISVHKNLVSTTRQQIPGHTGSTSGLKEGESTVVIEVDNTGRRTGNLPSPGGEFVLDPLQVADPMGAKLTTLVMGEPWKGQKEADKIGTEIQTCVASAAKRQVKPPKP